MTETGGDMVALRVSGSSTSYIATARRYKAAFCPQTPIYIDTPTFARPGNNVVGHASYWHEWGADGKQTLTTYIELRSGMTGTQLRHIAVHECAHIVQYRAYVTGRFDIENSYALQRFGAAGREAQADCMAYQ